MTSVFNQTEPTWITLGDKQIPLLFSMRAAAEMERELDTPYPQILEELFQRHEPETPEPPAMSWERQAAVIACLMRAGGLQASVEDIMDLHMKEFGRLCQAAVKEILFKTPQGSKKK